MLEKQVQVFVTRNNVSVLTTLLQNGQPHSAALHFANSWEPFCFIFLTEKASRKCQNLKPGIPSSASLVIGFNELEMQTLQFEGTVEIVIGEELVEAWETYRQKYPLAKATIDQSLYVLLKFKPNWWRYTDLKTKPWKIITSE